MPPRFSRAAYVLAFFGVSLYLVARSTGSGWVTFIVAGLVGFGLVGLAWPLVVIARLRLSVTAPVDGTAGRPLSVAVTVRGPATRIQLCSVSPAGPWRRCAVPTVGAMEVVPPQRGLIDAVVADVRCGAPFGLVWWRRRFAVPLARTLEVGPVPADVSLPAEPFGGRDQSAASLVGHLDVRTVREYVPGDPARLVHWAATAHRDNLMVKELDDPDSPQLAIVADLSDDAEATASRAAGLALAGLRAGVPVLLLTAERRGPVVSPVTSALQVSRRLARAVPGPVPDGPLPTGARVVRA